MARAEVRENPRAPDDLKEFSKIRLEDAETGVHTVLRKYGLACKVQIDTKNLGPKQLADFPYIKLSSWFQYLTTARIARQFCGVSSLQKMKRVLAEFWKRYQAVHPNHDIFQRARQGALDLPSTIPYFSHSDEGRAYKKEALWIFSVHGCLGRGTLAFLKRRKHKAPLHRNEMGLNFVGQSLSTQFIFSTLLRETATDHPGVLQSLLKIFAEDAQVLFRQGFQTQEGHQLWAAHLGSKGDLPALGKVGNFVRTFSHVPRAPKSRKPCEGICFRCLAGQEKNERNGKEDFPFEDLSRSPAWVSTIDRVEPWNTFPPLLEGAPVDRDQPSSFYCIDLWHVFHLGIAKHFVGSSLAVIVESTIFQF